jgi:hypothetical protein
MKLNGDTQSILGDLFDLSDLPLVFVVGVQVISQLELAVELVKF